VSEKGDLPASAPVVGRADSFEDTARWHSLASRIQQGDGGAEEELATRFHGRVRALAASWLDGSDVAQDIAQETILAVIQALRAGKLREPEKLPAFVLSTARNLVNNRCRQVARAREVSEDPPATPGRDGFALAVAAERRTLVRTALARLNAVDRRILLFTLIENMTPREIAPLVGLNPGAVRARTTRAVRAVIEEVGEVSRKRLADHIGRSGPRT